jgi:nicotinamide mononucleotide transporter
MDLLGWAATATSIIGIGLNARKNIYCWPVWLLSNVLWISHAIILKDAPSIFLWAVFGISNIYGWFQWKKDKNKK